MYIYKSDADKLARNLVQGVVSELHEKNTMLSGLLKEDDWSFVIKGHALIEAAVTQLVVATVGNDSLNGFIQKLSLGGQFGKLKLCEQVDVLPPAQRRFVRWLSDLRNPLVHNIEKISFTFTGHLTTLTKEQLAQWLDAVVWFSPEDKRTQKTWRQVAAGDAAKCAVWMGLYLVVNECTVQSHHADAIRSIHATSEQTMRSLARPAEHHEPYSSKYLAAVNKILSDYASGGDAAAASQPKGRKRPRSRKGTATPRPS